MQGFVALRSLRLGVLAWTQPNLEGPRKGAKTQSSAKQKFFLHRESQSENKSDIMRALSQDKLTYFGEIL